jgi:hypothetical protein
VFSDCEEPFVSSGREAMAFYWKGNALYTRRLQLDESDYSPDTSFVLDYRNTTTAVPGLRPLCGFLAGSLTFVGLESIELWLDDWNLLRLTKNLSPSEAIPIPRDIKVKTEEGLMTVARVQREIAQVDAVCMKAVEWTNPAATSVFEAARNSDTTASLKSFFSRLTGQKKPADKSASAESHKVLAADLTMTTKSSVFLHNTTAHITTSVSQSFSRELERATKKPPPRSTKLALLTSTYTGSDGDKPSGILAAVLPSKTGRIYIGFATHQTTGLNAHIAAQSVIPTVERESIDLNARWVRTWNLELLRAAGILARIAWSAEMATLKEKLAGKLKQSGRSKPSMDDVNAVLGEAVHISNQFVFREATPAAQVGQVIENSFWTCSQNAYLEVLSTRGILPTHQVRIASGDLRFMSGIPALPQGYVEGAGDFVRRLTDFGLVTDVTVSDIKAELEANTIPSSQVTEFISWVANKAASGKMDRLTIKSLLDVAIAERQEAEGKSTGLIVLREIKGYLNPRRIPSEFPLPPFVMPFEYTKSIPLDHLEAVGWVELQTDAWVRWLVESHQLLGAEHDMTRTAAFSARILPVLSRQWDSLEPSVKASLVGLLQSHTVIPTKMGMKKPGEAYFPTVKLFDDLPVVSGLNNVKDRFMAALGVRKTVELNVIFSRLLDGNVAPGSDEKSGQRKWSHVELIKYLASVAHDIPAEDIAKLKSTPICTAESKDESKATTKRYRVSELLEPKDSLRDLGFPLLYWPKPYVPSSPEGQFLALLGLKSHPLATELIQLMAQGSDIGARARKYFITEYAKADYGSYNFVSVTTAFVPTESGKLTTPSRCYTDPGALLLGFDILQKDLYGHATKFGVKTHPPIDACVNILLHKPPNTRERAVELFRYFSTRGPDLTSQMVMRLGQAAIVPILQNLPGHTRRHSEIKPASVRHVPPRECYLGSSDDYEDIFTFVDFGQHANMFLQLCGAKQLPTDSELASVLVKEPARVLAMVQTPERYLRLLRNIANSMKTIKRDSSLLKEMKKSPFLFASREMAPKAPSHKVPKLVDDTSYDDDEDEDEEQGIKEWQLVKATDAVIVDDYVGFNLFKEKILAAPQEELLENMYTMLGTPSLSRLIEEEARCGNLGRDQTAARALEKRIFERSRVFLHDVPRDMIRLDATGLEKQLTVQVVASLSLCRSLRGHNLSHVEKRSAVVTRKHGRSTLHITAGKIDFYQVSQALVQLMLSRAKLNSAVTLEMILKSDLLELQSRGYNVRRILKQKAAQARIAETKQKEQLEAERKQREEERQNQIVNQDLLQPMPGVFPESPVSDHFPDSKAQRGSSIFSDIGERFGRLGLSDFMHRRQRSRSRGSLDGPPPYSPADPNNPGVTSPDNLRSNLAAAVKSCRPYGSSSLFNRGENNQVAETKTYCDERPSQDLVHTGKSTAGIKIFLSKNGPDRTKFLDSHGSGINAFASILVDCANIFSIRPDTISIFDDPTSKTIAFNSQGSIFCNYLYFDQLHSASMLQGHRADTLIYWWVIFCHELAHNLVADHSSRHSYYT